MRPYGLKKGQWAPAIIARKSRADRNKREDRDSLFKQKTLSEVAASVNALEHELTRYSAGSIIRTVTRVVRCSGQVTGSVVRASAVLARNACRAQIRSELNLSAVATVMHMLLICRAAVGVRRVHHEFAAKGVSLNRVLLLLVAQYHARLSVDRVHPEIARLYLECCDRFSTIDHSTHALVASQLVKHTTDISGHQAVAILFFMLRSGTHREDLSALLVSHMVQRPALMWGLTAAQVVRLSQTIGYSAPSEAGGRAIAGLSRQLCSLLTQPTYVSSLTPEQLAACLVGFVQYGTPAAALFESTACTLSYPGMMAGFDRADLIGLLWCYAWYVSVVRTPPPAIVALLQNITAALTDRFANSAATGQEVGELCESVMRLGDTAPRSLLALAEDAAECVAIDEDCQLTLPQTAQVLLFHGVFKIPMPNLQGLLDRVERVIRGNAQPPEAGMTVTAVYYSAVAVKMMCATVSPIAGLAEAALTDEAISSHMRYVPLGRLKKSFLWHSTVSNADRLAELAEILGTCPRLHGVVAHLLSFHPSAPPVPAAAVLGPLALHLDPDYVADMIDTATTVFPSAAAQCGIDFLRLVLNLDVSTAVPLQATQPLPVRHPPRATVLPPSCLPNLG